MPQQLEGSNLNHSTWKRSSRFSVLSEVDVDNKFTPFAAHFQKSTLTQIQYSAFPILWGFSPLLPLVPFQVVHYFLFWQTQYYHSQDITSADEIKRITSGLIYRMS